MGLRWSRACFLAGVAMLTGTVAHVSAGGYLPGPAAMAWIFLACLVASASQLGRRASHLRVALLLMAGQTFFHGALTAMGGHRGDPPLTRAPSVPHLHPAAASLPTERRVGSLYDQLYAGRTSDPAGQLSIPTPVQHLLADLTGPHALMALAHLLAAAVMGLWIARGERALWVLLAAGTDVARLAVGTAARQCLVAARSLHSTLALVRTQDRLLRRWHGPPAWRLRRPARFHVLADLLIRRGPPPLLAA